MAVRRFKEDRGFVSNTEAHVAPRNGGSMNVRISSIGVIQTAKTLAVLYAIVGIVAGIVACLAIVSEPFHLNNDWVLRAIIALFVIPLAYALFGFIGTAVSAWIYNIIAAKTGGVAFTMTNVQTNSE
jgi:hypothetical protein